MWRYRQSQDWHRLLHITGKKHWKLLRNAVEHPEQCFHLRSQLCHNNKNCQVAPVGKSASISWSKNMKKNIRGCHHYVLYYTASVLLSVLPTTEVRKSNFSGHVISSHSYMLFYVCSVSQMMSEISHNHCRWSQMFCIPSWFHCYIFYQCIWKLQHKHRESPWH